MQEKTLDRDIILKLIDGELLNLKEIVILFDYINDCNINKSSLTTNLKFFIFLRTYTNNYIDKNNNEEIITV